ncbi:hypothetical protein [Phenylobacterium sp.]|uniref:SMODS domain-containing nucleotidyltransferase n=1 Tax=Phenylobacterium sp. TaxID=1871053 RepID=UPI0035AF0B76
MAKTVEAAFNELISGIKTTATEAEAAKSHRRSLSARLTDTFGMTGFFRSGSFGSGTNVAWYSDVDYFAIIPDENLDDNSAVTLGQVAADLRLRYPTTEGIRVDSPGVAVPFGLDGAEHTEIIPVQHVGYTKLGYREFRMPDGAGGWMFSAPESHNAFVSEIDDGLNCELKPLIRLIKAWKYYRSVPIKSFYLELSTAEYGRGETYIHYPSDVARMLARLKARALSDLLDPRFPNDGNFIKAANTELQRQDAITKLERAATWASQAVEFGREGKVRAAFERWDLVFNGMFPAYTGLTWV